MRVRVRVRVTVSLSQGSRLAQSLLLVSLSCGLPSFQSPSKMLPAGGAAGQRCGGAAGWRELGGRKQECAQEHTLHACYVPGPAGLAVHHADASRWSRVLRCSPSTHAMRTGAHAAARRRRRRPWPPLPHRRQAPAGSVLMPCPCILPSFHCPTYLLSVRHVYVPKPWIRPNCTCGTTGHGCRTGRSHRRGPMLLARSDAARVLAWSALRF